MLANNPYGEEIHLRRCRYRGVIRGTVMKPGPPVHQYIIHRHLYMYYIYKKTEKHTHKNFTVYPTAVSLRLDWHFCGKV